MKELKQRSSSEEAQERAQARELKQGSSSEGAQERELKQGSSREGARGGKQAGRQASRQASRQALGRHSVGAMPWMGLFVKNFHFHTIISAAPKHIQKQNKLV